MELWIRSQDKTILKKVNVIGIIEGDDKWFVSESITMDFGSYKTKERALEVLDEIQNKLSETNDSYENLVKKLEIFNETPIISCNNNDDCTISLNITMLKEMVIYEMPKE